MLSARGTVASRWNTRGVVVPGKLLLGKAACCSPVLVGSSGGKEPAEDDGSPPDEGVPKKISPKGE